MGRIFGYFVLTIFLVAIIISIIAASGNEKLLDKLDTDAAPEVEKVESKSQSEKVQPQAMHLDPDLPLSYAIHAPNLNQTFLLEDASVNDIKHLVNRDIPVMVSVDTKKLKNPFYEVDGEMHLTIVGFTSLHFETIETYGETRRRFSYLIDDFMRALEATGGDVMYVL